jgi:hypothetical protein
MTAPLCTDCRFISPLGYLCVRPITVDRRPVAAPYQMPLDCLCEYERDNGTLWFSKNCGPKGQFFEAKESS